MRAIGRWVFEKIPTQMYFFETTSGKLLSSVDESEEVYKKAFEEEQLAVDSFHFNRKLKMEASIREKALGEGLESPINCVFAQGGRFAAYGCMMGVKIVNVGLCETFHVVPHRRVSVASGRSGEQRAVPERESLPGHQQSVAAGESAEGLRRRCD